MHRRITKGESTLGIILAFFLIKDLMCYTLVSSSTEYLQCSAATFETVRMLLPWDTNNNNVPE